jgi:hypothetical protein
MNEAEHELRREVMRNPKEYPNLFDLIGRKNRWKQSQEEIQ